MLLLAPVFRRLFFCLSSVLVLLAGCSGKGGVQAPLPPAGAVRSAAFEQETGAMMGRGLVPGNRLTTLSNGNEIFPAMLSAIRQARQTINFETYVYFDGDVPAGFAEALAERARAGVKVNVILDAHGSKKSRKFHKSMRAAGVNLEIYHPIFFWDIRRYNYRTHRKLLIVDGKTGFIGGVGIADDWDGDARNPDEWRDLHFRVEGPVVAQLQATFAANWFQTHREVLQGPEYFPALSAAGSVRATVLPSAPKQSQFAIEQMYHIVLASARESILIENAYFLPNKPLLDALCGAARRGVKVRILMPGEHIDQKAVRRASRKRWPKLIEAGVEFYEFEPTMIHTKLLVVDGWFVSVGSANFDPRSLRINDEANLNVIDERFAAEMTRIFEKDLQRAGRVSLENGDLTTAAQTPVGVVQAPVESQL